MSDPGDWIATLVGAGLLLLLLWDVFTTTFHATGRGGPVSRTQNRLVWGGIRRLGWGAGGPRPRILALAGPLMALGTIVVWALLMVTGHAILYLPHIADFYYGTGVLGSPVQEAFTYSGIVASTLGLGDVVPPDGPLRIITVTEALGGFGLLTVSVSYVLAVYRELIEARGLAGAIDAHLWAGEGDAAAEPGIELLEGCQEELTSRLLQVTEAQHQYPILHYFRPSDLRHALPVQLDRLLRLYEADARRVAAGDASAREGWEDRSHLALRRAMVVYLGEVHRLFVPGEVAEDGPMERMRQQLDDLLSWLHYPPGSRAGRAGGEVPRSPDAIPEEAASEEPADGEPARRRPERSRIADAEAPWS